MKGEIKVVSLSCILRGPYSNLLTPVTQTLCIPKGIESLEETPKKVPLSLLPEQVVLSCFIETYLMGATSVAPLQNKNHPFQVG